MANLFAKAKTSTSKNTKGKDEKTRISIQDATFFDRIEKLESLQDAKEIRLKRI
jgi:hypothetical protein